MRKIKVALIHNIISPYRIPVFNELAKKKNLDFTVLFLSDSARDRQWDTAFYKKQIKFKYKILPNIKLIFPFKNIPEYNINLSIFKELHKEKYDVIISCGWVDFASQIAPFLKKIFNYKFILWSGSTKDEPSLQRKITLPLVKLIVKKSDYFIAYGNKAKKYLLLLGAPKKKIVCSFNSIDVTHFKKYSRLLSKQQAIKLRKKYGLAKDHKLLLYVGQFIDRKNIEVLIKATSLIKDKNITLILLGYGSKKSDYLKLAKKSKVNLKIINHLELDKVPSIYAIADLFILPSKEEAWGLVVNEAMACGLPVLVSDKVGCVDDLVIEGKNGFSFRYNNPKELAKKIDMILKNKKLRTAMGKYGQKIISGFTSRKAADVFYKEIRKIE